MIPFLTRRDRGRQYRDDDSDLNDASPMPSPVPAGGGAFGRFDSQGTAGTDGQEEEEDLQTDREGERK